MKKIFTLLVLLVLISGTCPAFSQYTEKHCPQKENVRRLVKAGNSIARFMDNLQNTTTQTNWSKFLQDANSGKGLDAFDVFGIRTSNLKDSLKMAADAVKYPQ